LGDELYEDSKSEEGEDADDYDVMARIQELEERANMTRRKSQGMKGPERKHNFFAGPNAFAEDYASNHMRSRDGPLSQATAAGRKGTTPVKEQTKVKYQAEKYSPCRFGMSFEARSPLRKEKG